MAYRGPDAEGLWCSRQRDGSGVGLGHRRLSIIDLSEAGRQPMCSEDGSVRVVFNGEIYNFKTLRNELKLKGHRFRSNTDTEVIVHLYEEEGLAACRRLNGMFAFALWDAHRERLWLCRDRLGIKPLVYYWDGEQFLFASEIKAILIDPEVPRQLDATALQLYLAFSYIPAPYTIYMGLRKLNPGHSLVYQGGRLQIDPYWELSCDDASGSALMDTPDGAVSIQKRLLQRLSDAVRDQLIADVPLGAFLSGGIDSSAVVALMAKHSATPIKTFSIGFRDDPLYDETGYARQVADHFRTDHREFKLAFKDMLDVLPDVMDMCDEPFSDSSVIPTYIVARETRKYVTVALSGDGGDELFGGYRSYLGQYWYRWYTMIPALFREAYFERLVMSLPDSRDTRWKELFRRAKKFIKGSKGRPEERYLALKEIFPERLRQDLLRDYRLDGKDPALMLIQRRLQECGGDSLNALMYTDVIDSLPGDMLNKVDWMSMKNSLEVRVPLLDHRVVELAFQIPGRWKLRGGVTKYLLKEAFRDILPRSLYRRPKAGFEVPISRWLRTDLKFLVERYLAKQRIADQGIFDHRVIDGLVQTHFQKRTDTSWMLWNLIVFQYWFDTYYV